MKTPFVNIILFVIIIFLSACEYEQEWELDTGESLLVVEGMVTNENKHHYVKLHYSVNRLNEDAVPVSDAFVYVSDGDSSYFFTEDTSNPGTYLSDKEFAGKVYLNYTLLISVNNRSYTAQDQMVPVSLTGPLSVESVSDSVFRIAEPGEQFAPLDVSAWEITADWSRLDGCSLSDTCTLMQYFYKLSTSSVNQIFSPDREQVSFPKGSTVIQKKYAVSDAYENYLRGVLSETTWNGGLFDLQSGNPETNLSEGAVGFFAACGVKKYALIAE